MMAKYKCLCCGNNTLNEQPPGTYEICPICNWEDDEVQFNDAGGANELCLNDAQENINMLKQKEIKTEAGISSAELKQIEELYGIKFPKSLREFLMAALPVSDGFYNWRDFSAENISYIKNAIVRPMEALIELAEEVEWCESWGPEPESVTEKVAEVKKRLQKAPILIPVYFHRYMPMVEAENPPILSIHGADVIYYGENLSDYFEVEFGVKKQQDITFEHILPMPFWSEIM